MTMFAFLKIFSFLPTVFQSLFPTSESRLAHELALEKIKTKPENLHKLLQVAESKNKNVLISGWRSFNGWIFGAINIMGFIIKPLLEGITRNHYQIPIPYHVLMDIDFMILAFMGSASYRLMNGIRSYVDRSTQKARKKTT